MQVVLGVFAGAVFVAWVIAFVRVVRGPTLWDRLSGLVLMGTKTLILLLVIGQISGQPEMFVDIALAYALIGFLAALTLAKYFEGGGDRDSGAGPGTGPGRR